MRNVELYWNGIQAVALNELPSLDAHAVAQSPSVLLVADFFQRPALEVALDVVALRRRGLTAQAA